MDVERRLFHPVRRSRLNKEIVTQRPQQPPRRPSAEGPQRPNVPASGASSFRVERDSLGEMQVPAEVYYGASTARAVRNFPVSGLRFPRPFLRALGLIKRAAAEVNMDLGLLDRRLGEAIVQAATEVADGALDDQFVLDIFQTGSGTSTNTNANEVIANRAAELLGGARGSKLVHPNDDVNIGQSSNDVIPTAMHLANLAELEEVLIPAVQRLRDVLDE